MSLKKAITLFIIFSISILSNAEPQPGDIYREFAIDLKTGDNWRVTDPDATNSGAAAYLPNPILSINLSDLEGAVRAEVLLDIWGGHIGTIDRKFRFNDHVWIDIPFISKDKYYPPCYLAQYNVVLDLPLEYLREGRNTFQGTSGRQVCNDFGWGQWGWYAMVIRIYYDDEKPHVEAKISYPQSGGILDDNPTLLIETEDTSAVSLIQVIGKYAGYDEDGDGDYNDWHRAYHNPLITGHIGSTRNYPYQIQWDTHYVPDQENKALSFIARIQDTSGVWYVTEIVDSISLIRNHSLSVKMYKASDVPDYFSIRAGKKKSCSINIDTLHNAVNATLFHRTWNAADDASSSGSIKKPLTINKDKYKCYGRNHFYALSSVPLAVSSLKNKYNYISYSSDTQEHGIEVLWPGPAIIVRYFEGGEMVADPTITPENNFTFKEPFYPTITNETEGSYIYYTSDGTDPNQSDNRFLGSLIVEKDMTIKVRAFKNDYHESNVVTANYYKEFTTGISGIDVDGKFQLYPNPAISYLKFNIPDENKNGDYTIRDSRGQIIKTGKANGNIIPVNELNDGYYIINYQGSNCFKEKFIILR